MRGHRNQGIFKSPPLVVADTSLQNTDQNLAAHDTVTAEAGVVHVSATMGGVRANSIGQGQAAHGPAAARDVLYPKPAIASKDTCR